MLKLVHVIAMMFILKLMRFGWKYMYAMQNWSPGFTMVEVRQKQNIHARFDICQLVLYSTYCRICIRFGNRRI
jgi:hypothetical protein